MGKVVEERRVLSNVHYVNGQREMNTAREVNASDRLRQDQMNQFICVSYS